MKGRILVTLAAFSSLAIGCTAYVLGSLKDVGDGPDGGASSSSSGGVQKEGFCDLTKPDASNACSRCITTNCKADLDYACQPPDAAKRWFSSIKDCAESPARGGGPGTTLAWGCDREYNDFDAQPFTGTDDNAKQRASELCIRDNCVKPKGVPGDCKLCVTGARPATGGGEYPLDHSDCGKCLVDKCAVPISDCCTRSIIQYTVAACGYIDDPDLKTKCQSIATLDAGDFSSSDEKTCATQLKTCYAQCRTQGCP
jgi:hypothetical protein